MKIVDVRSAVVVVPLARPVSWATAAVTEREYVLVWVVGEDGGFVGMDSFGASGPYEELYKHFGITPEGVAEKAETLLKQIG